MAGNKRPPRTPASRRRSGARAARVISYRRNVGRRLFRSLGNGRFGRPRAVFAALCPKRKICLTRRAGCAMIRTPLLQVYFFVRIFRCAACRKREAIGWRCRNNACKNRSCLHGVQTAQLQHQEELEEQPGPDRDEEVLPLLQKAYGPPRDEVRKADKQHG